MNALLLRFSDGFAATVVHKILSGQCQQHYMISLGHGEGLERKHAFV